MDFNPDGKISKHWELQLELAEDIDLGSRDYNLIQILVEDAK